MHDAFKHFWESFQFITLSIFFIETIKTFLFYKCCKIAHLCHVFLNPCHVIIIDYAYYKYEVQLQLYVNIIKKMHL